MRKKIIHTGNQTHYVLFNELSRLIEESERQLVSAANSTLTMLFWQIGHRINENILQNKRADYGKQIVVTLSRQLEARYGNNFEEKNLRRMLQFNTQFPDWEIVVTLSRQLSWSHFLALIPIKNKATQLFYAEKAGLEMWGIRELRKNIAEKVFERTSIAKMQLHDGNTNNLNVFKDPYFLNFLGLKDEYLEKDMKAAILRQLEKFILEIGKGFAFVERQKRMIIDGEDYHLDLLFYHRKLKRLVAIDLKIGKFQAKDKGQMELYLYWRRPLA